MGLKILTLMETDKGSTSTPYVRIAGYIVNKYTSVVLMVEVFKSQEDATSAATIADAVAISVKSTEVSDVIYIAPLDVASLENTSIFTYGYQKLKEKLIGIYGAENIVDC